ncbi:Lipoprotein-releasing system ATP-binding protein LolD [hydrothermal vent metagenome]|uniref:Lipoprotein-releasing system ATP-binding protein LolD n=1 Tax=hydrothermal vent metagenome TaxID=652676 RepID=A0A3B0XVJ0_9ZZZZ
MSRLNPFTDSQIFPAGTGMPVIMEAVDLCMSFTEGGGNRLDVLQNVNLSVKAGEKVAIVGASGSGKSTLLHLLGGLDKPTSGQVFIGEKDLVRMSEKARCRLRNNQLGFVYQFHHLLAEFTAQENVAMPALVRGSSPSQALSLASALLDKVGMTRRLDHKPAELSGGERQRAAIARAVINEPRCICADEPTGNLDKATAEQVIQVLMRLNNDLGTSLIVVTHDMEFAKRMDTIYTIESGHLKAL